MPLGYPVESIIRKTLDEKRKVLSRTKTPDPYSPRKPETKKEYQKNVIKSTYIFMVSSPIFQKEEVKKSQMLSGTIILGNQEYNKRSDKTNYGIDLYGTKTSKGMTGYQDMRYFKKTGKKDKRYRPTAGVTSLSSEYLSSNNVQFVRHITINWTCFTLEDLEELGERFLTLGRKVYVEWGLAQNKSRPQLITKEGEVDTSGINFDEEDSEATRLRNKVIQEGKGEFDAAIGWVNNFNWSSREDGGFDCTTELTIQGVNALEGPTNITDDEVETGKPKFKENPSTGFSQFSFSKALQDLPLLGREYHKNLWVRFGDLKEVGYGTNLTYREDTGRYKAAGGTRLRERTIYSSYVTAKSITESEDGTGTIEEPSRTSEKIIVNKNFLLTYKHHNIQKDVDYTIGNDNNNWFTQMWKDPSKDQAYNNNLGTKTNLNNIKNTTGTFPPEKCWVRWGWFEDNVLNKYFALVDESNLPISQFRSAQPIKEQRDLVKEWESQREPTKPEYKLIEEGGGRVYRVNKATGKKEFSHHKGRETNEEYMKNYDGPTMGAPDPNANYVDIEYESSTINTHPDFKTTDINKFIFPGKFEIEMDESINRERTESIQTRKKELEKQIGAENSEDNKGKNDKERRILNEIKRLDAELQATSDAQENINKYFRVKNEDGTYGDFKTIKELQADVANFKVTDENTDFTESAIIPYLRLYSLAEATKELSPFQVTDIENSGYLRNIMINVKHLQDIFSNQSATLAENLNALFDSLTRETGGLVNMIIVADNNIKQGNLKMEERGFDAKEAKKLKKLKQQGAIYEFPVGQNDSFVKSQELSSDISSENYKILLSKSYSERIKEDKKKGISLIHHANISVLDSKGNVKSEDERYEGVGKNVKLAFEVDKDFGQIDGDINQELRVGGGLTPSDLLRQYEQEELSKIRKGQNEKDLEQQNNIFRELDIAYTTSGKLKSHLYEEMKELVGFREVVVVEGDEGKEYTIKLPNVNDYGMVGITNTLTMEGIAGIYPSNVFTTTYLPQKFRDHCHFYATDVGQTIDSTGWTTAIEGRMVWKYIITDIKSKVTEEERKELEDNKSIGIDNLEMRTTFNVDAFKVR